ncbi:MAG: lysylphosphatidylglycerol synthase domain-containing protein [Saprospiraceae bacterium]
MARKATEFILKALLLLAFGFFLWWELFQKQDADLLLNNFLSRFSQSNPTLLYITIALVPINWALEAMKWWLLVLEFEKIKFSKAFRAVLIGVSIGIFTPSRLGEYGGRAILVKSDHVVESVVATFLGSISQLLATLFFGYIGAIYFMHYFSMVSDLILWFLMMLGLFSFLLTLFFFYNIDLMMNIFRRLYRKVSRNVSVLQKVKKVLINWLEHVNVLQNYSNRQLSTALFTAFLRYAVYSTQYFLLLTYMGIEMDLLIGISSIATVFLLQSSIPLPPVSGLLMRGGTALYIWQFFSANQVSILATTFSLWLLNVILPAIIGLILLLNVKFFRTK